jgi:hypothetical protein
VQTADGFGPSFGIGGNRKKRCHFSSSGSFSATTTSNAEPRTNVPNEPLFCAFVTNEPENRTKISRHGPPCDEGGNNGANCRDASENISYVEVKGHDTQLRLTVL